MKIAQKSTASTILLSGNINGIGNRKFRHTSAKMDQHIKNNYVR